MLLPQGFMLVYALDTSICQKHNPFVETALAYRSLSTLIPLFDFDTVLHGAQTGAEPMVTKVNLVSYLSNKKL